VVFVPDRAAHRRAESKKPRRGRVARLLKSCLQRVGSACASTEQAPVPLNCPGKICTLACAHAPGPFHYKPLPLGEFRSAEGVEQVRRRPPPPRCAFPVLDLALKGWGPWRLAPLLPAAGQKLALGFSGTPVRSAPSQSAQRYGPALTLSGPLAGNCTSALQR
jgi:hypothetical protein